MSPLLNTKIPIRCSDDNFTNFCDSAPPIPSDASDVPIQLPQSYKSGSHHVSNLLIVAAALLSFAAVLFLTLYLLLRRRRRRRLARTHHVIIPQHPLAQVNADDDDQQGEMHHVWLIRTVGLDDATIKSITLFEYRSEDKVSDVGDCAVCLTEFQDGEKLRLLPKCNHAFHVPCIDTWLRSHVNCPLCRAPVLAPSKHNTSSEQSSQNLEETLIGESGEDVDENRDNLGAENSIQIVVDPPSSELTPQSDVERSNNDFQAIRRSVSMDSLLLGAIRREIAESTNKEDLKQLSFRGEQVAKDKGQQASSTKDISFQRMSIGMKRSMSSSGGCWFFPTRQGRVSRSSILPL